MSLVSHTDLILPGSVGNLQAVLAVPQAPLQGAGVICHPHPLFSGTMNSKIVTTLEKIFLACGVAALRFNFRGVGTSEGHYDQCIGEVDDALAAVDWLKNRYPQLPIWLAGFSFGGSVAIRAATRYPASRLITVAPSIINFSITQEEKVACPWIIVQGEGDDIVPESAVLAWAQQRPERPPVMLIPQAGHFFHGRLSDLRMRVLEALNAMV